MEVANNEENKEKQDYCVDLLRILDQLDEEAKSLSSQKEDLLTIEEELWFRLNEEIEARRKKNVELRSEVEEQRMKCVELTRILNEKVREQ
jgi:hypothetical protein